jgi:hypothetical protein
MTSALGVTRPARSQTTSVPLVALRKVALNVNPRLFAVIFTDGLARCR